LFINIFKVNNLQYKYEHFISTANYVKTLLYKKKVFNSTCHGDILSRIVYIVEFLKTTNM